MSPALVRALRGLPLIRFALMLGAGMVASAGAAWLIAILGHGRWPAGEAVALARIHSLTWLALGMLALVAIVLVALAWGQLGKLHVTVAGAAVELDFEDGEGGR